MIPQHLLKRDDVRTEEEKRNNLQQMRREVQEQIRKKRTESELKPEKKDLEKKEAGDEDLGKKETGDEVLGKEKAGSGTKPPEQRVRHRKYGEGILVSEDEMMVEVEFPGYGRKQFLKAFGEEEML